MGVDIKPNSSSKIVLIIRNIFKIYVFYKIKMFESLFAKRN